MSHTFPLLRVVLADDHASVRAAVRSILASLAGVGLAAEATTGNEALDLIRAQRPDVAVLDIRLPGINGVDVARRAWADSPETAIVLLAMKEEAPPGGLPDGIAALVSKECAADELPAALEAVARGRRFVSPLLEGSPPSILPLPATARPAWIDE